MSHHAMCINCGATEHGNDHFAHLCGGCLVKMDSQERAWHEKVREAAAKAPIPIKERA